MSEQNDAAHINGETRRRLVELLGNLMLDNVSNSVRADYYQQSVGGLANSFEAVQAEVEKLKAEIAATGPAPEDLSKLSFDALSLELRHRGYDVVARAATLEDASPLIDNGEAAFAREPFPSDPPSFNEEARDRRPPGIGD